MKKRIIGLSVFLLAATAFLSSFTNQHEAGSLVVTATYDGNPTEGVLVGISSSEENLENSVYIHEDETDSKGIIRFDHLHPGTYYLDADYTEGDISVYVEAKVEITTEEAHLTMVLEED